MKTIRWPGLIAFLVIVGVLVGGTLLFSESIVESIMENSLTSLNKARVDIGSVDIGYTPLSLSVNDIQVTDRARPMINSVQIGQARFALSFGDLLLKKVIVDDMSLSGIRVDTPRKYSGAIRKTKKPEAETTDDESMFDRVMPDIAFPNVGELLKTEPLRAEQSIDQLNQDLDNTQKQWVSIRDDIRDEKRWNKLEARYKKIRNDFRGDSTQKLAAIKDAKRLRDDLKKELDRVRDARRQISSDTDRLEDEYRAAKAAPGQDIERIKQKYKLDDINAGNITELLFGPKAADYLAIAQTWYRRLKPYLEGDEDEPEIVRFEGEDIAFREFNPKPGFYVRTAAIDAEVPRGRFSGSMTDISSNQSVSGKPMRFKLAGQNMRHRDSEELSGEFNYVRKDQGYSQVNYRIKSYRLENLDISRGEKLSLNMARSLMDFDLGTRLQSGQISGQADVQFNDVRFEAGTASSGTLTRMLAASFADVRQFNINARFKGNLKDMDIDINSNLDRQIGDQFRNQINARKQQFEKELQARIDAKLSEPLAKVEAKKQRLDELRQQIDAKEQELNMQLADLDNKIDQEKDIQKQKLQNKIDDKKDNLKKKLLDKFKL